MMDRVDNHSHIIHANIRDMITIAQSKNIADFSITEHVSQFQELRESVKFGSTHNTGRVFGSLKEYDMEFASISELHHETRIHRGLEVDFSPRFESTVGEFVNRAEWNILLCSVHEFQNKTDIEKGPATSSKHEPYSRWREYLQLETLALESDFVPFHVLAHPVRMSRGLDAYPAEMEVLLFDLAATARRRAKALELNGNDIDYNEKLVRMLAIACAKAGCKVSLGSDAHYPREVFRNMETARSLIDEFELEQFVPVRIY